MMDEAPKWIGLISDGLGLYALARRDETDVAIHYLRADAVDRLIAGAVAAETERCAVIADAQEARANARADDDDEQTDFQTGVLFGTEMGARFIAAAIRAVKP